tara:strand:+ start:23509 stop:24477 length:969 start_codon:yes stop_codon:yes gene_type:complete
MDFQHPLFLLLIIIIPIIYLWIRYYRHKWEGVVRFSSSTFILDQMIKVGTYKSRFLLFSHFTIIFLIIIALARPRLLHNLQKTNINVIDMMMVLDISSSMLADDFSPNRLEVVKRTASDFIAGRSTDRIGILVFAGESFIQCPLTIDKGILKSLVKEINVASKEHDGTAIGMAIANATNRLRNSQVDSRVMILLSDGSNNAGEIDPKTAADLASQYGIRIYTIGAGTDQSYTRIPGRGLIRNEIDEETLIHIATKTGGKYYRATDEKALEKIYDEIDMLEKSEIEVREFIKYKELYGWFLIPGLIIGLSMETFRRSIFRSKT